MTSFTTKKILMVDDMTTIRNILKKDLESIGCKDYGFAEDGEDAWQKILKQAETSPYELILCDWNMPRLTGLELLQRIRAHSIPKIREVRFLMITGSDEKVKTAMDAGADNFISKPFTAEDLKKKIEFIMR